MIIDFVSETIYNTNFGKLKVKLMRVREIYYVQLKHFS